MIDESSTLPFTTSNQINFVIQNIRPRKTHNNNSFAESADDFWSACDGIMTAVQSQLDFAQQIIVSRHTGKMLTKCITINAIKPICK